MVTSWPRNLPGPGMNAQRLADRIGQLSGGRLTVQLFAAGELVPALQVLDAVFAGTAEMGHSASFYWAGKIKARAVLHHRAVRPDPAEHQAWIEHGGGQALWDELYAPFGLKPFMAGNSGLQMGGWFRHEINGLADLKGLKLRSAGLGGELFQRLGAVTVSLGVPDIFPALQSGTIDGVEFLGPASDLARGLLPDRQAATTGRPSTSRTAPPSASSAPRPGTRCRPTCGRSWRHACAAENAYTLAESDARDGRGAGGPRRPARCQPAPLARGWSWRRPAGGRGAAGRVRRRGRHRAARRTTPTTPRCTRLEPWSRVSAEAFLGARAGD